MARPLHLHPASFSRTVRMGSMNLPDDPRRPDPRRDLPHPEAALGGADDVEKTSYVTGSGTSPEARKADDVPIARVSAGGMSMGGWILMVVVAAIALLFGASLFT